MAANVKKIAELLGAKVVAQIPDTGGGAFGAARLAEIVATLQARLRPGVGKRPGRPTVVTWTVSPKVPMSAATEAKLARLAERVSTAERKISPMQLAAQLLEEVVAKLPDE
ncbi:MAG: hypothetical protein L0241_09095 [Planctomycetia bacterium]|nr:hypothetical protein [Planctomycetia bacterium]